MQWEPLLEELLLVQLCYLLPLPYYSRGGVGENRRSISLMYRVGSSIFILFFQNFGAHVLMVLCIFAAEEDPEVHLGQLKRFSLRELQVATDGFRNKNILGRGGFGKVYKGRLADGTLVAVKRLKEERTPGGELQFQTEVEMISMAVHRNLLRLRGFCMTPTERLLVYPYMANGSVASCLRGDILFNVFTLYKMDTLIISLL